MRHVNEQCVEDSYPLPRIEDLLVQQGGCEILSALDVKDAFHQMPMEESSRYITCTVNSLAISQWRVFGMGLRNGVQYCQTNVEVALRECETNGAGYVDDIEIGTKRESENETKRYSSGDTLWTSNESYEN